MQPDAVRSTLYTFAKSGVSASIAVNSTFKGANDKRNLAVYPYSRKNRVYSDADGFTTIYANLRVFLTLDVVTETRDSEGTTTDRESVWISYPHLYAFSKGLQDAVDMLKECIAESDEGGLIIPLEHRQAIVEIDKMVGGKKIVFRPTTRTDDTHECFAGALVYIGDAAPVFIYEDDLEAFNYIISKLDLYNAGVSTYSMALAATSSNHQPQSNFRRRTN